MVVLLICHNWFYWALFIINYEKYLQTFILQQIMFNFFSILLILLELHTTLVNMPVLHHLTKK